MAENVNVPPADGPQCPPQQPQPQPQPNPQQVYYQPQQPRGSMLPWIIAGFAAFAVFVLLLIAAAGVAFVVWSQSQSSESGRVRPDAFATTLQSAMVGPTATEDAELIQALFAEAESIIDQDLARVTTKGDNGTVLVDASQLKERLAYMLEAGSDGWQLSQSYPTVHQAIIKRFNEAGLSDESDTVSKQSMLSVCHEIHSAMEEVSGVQVDSHRGPPRAGFFGGTFSLLSWIIWLGLLFVLFLLVAGCVWAAAKVVKSSRGMMAGLVLLSIVAGLPVDAFAQDGLLPKAVTMDGRQFGFGYDLNKGPSEADELAKITDRLFGDDVQRLVAGTDEIKTVFLWRYFPKVGADAKAWDQEWLGSCVGFGSARACSNRLAIEVAELGKWSWVGNVSPDWVYGASRTITNTNDNGQGSTGAWAYRAITEWGCCFQRVYGDYDLTVYSPETSLVWQKKGVPGFLVEASKPFPVISAHRVKSLTEAKALLNNGCPIYTCSGVGYQGIKRDRYGFVAASGRWPHCMMIDGYRLASTGREGYHQTNSWGNTGSGPKWPDDMPEGSWWISPQDFERQIRANDTWAIGGVTGFRRMAIPLSEVLDFGGPIHPGENRAEAKPRNRSSGRVAGEVFALSP